MPRKLTEVKVRGREALIWNAPEGVMAVRLPKSVGSGTHKSKGNGSTDLK
jgi:hypothetical protein